MDKSLTIKLFAAVLLPALLLEGCSRTEGTATVEESRVTVRAAVPEDSPTKVSAPDGTALQWQEGDVIGVLTGSTFTPFTLEEGNGGSADASFSGNVPSGSEISDLAVYPYNASTSISGSTLSFYLPSEYSFGEGNLRVPMYAHLDDGVFKFYPMAGVLKFSYTRIPASAVSFVFSAGNDTVTGSFDVDLSGAQPVLGAAASGGNTVTVSLPSGLSGAVDFFIPVPAGAYSGFGICLKDASGNVVAGTAKDCQSQVSVGRGHIVPFSPVNPGMTVAEIIARSDNTVVSSPSLMVYAVNTRGAILGDGSGFLYAYNGSSSTGLSVGTLVSLSGTKTTYNGVPEITSPSFTTISTGNAVEYPEPLDITSSLSSYRPSVTEYVTLTGVLEQSGNYYNISVSGSSAKGSLSFPPAALQLSTFVNKTVKVTGFYVGTSSTIYKNIIATEIVIAEGDDPSGQGGNEDFFLEVPAFQTDSNWGYFTHYLTEGDLNVSTTPTPIRNYSYLYSYSDFAALWVAYPMYDLLNESNVKRNDNWAYDPLIPYSKQPNFSSSFGYSAGFDRGHQLPSADRLCSRGANNSVMYYTNLTLQNSTLNSGKWGTLENKVRAWADRCDTLYVVTGCILAESTRTITDKSGNDVTVPTGYWKALLAYTRSTGTYSAAAFLFDGNNATVSQQKMSVDALEERLGIDFFPHLEDRIGAAAAAAVEAETPGSFWN